MEKGEDSEAPPPRPPRPPRPPPPTDLSPPPPELNLSNAPSRPPHSVSAFFSLPRFPVPPEEAEKEEDGARVGPSIQMRPKVRDPRLGNSRGNLWQSWSLLVPIEISGC